MWRMKRKLQAKSREEKPIIDESSNNIQTSPSDKYQVLYIIFNSPEGYKVKNIIFTRRLPQFKRLKNQVVYCYRLYIICNKYKKNWTFPN